MMDFTVITVCLNAASTIRATIESVLVAGDVVSEYLVIDGGSTDGTLGIIKEYEPRFAGRMRWVSEPDEGLFFAMNRGLELAHGRFVLFLGADDRLVAGALEAISEQIGASEGIDLIYGDVFVVEPDGSIRAESGCENPGLVGGIARAMPACHQATLFSLDAYRRLGGFDTSLRIAADYELYLRFIEAGMKSAYVPVTIAEFSLEGVSGSQGSATADEYRRVWIMHGVSPGTATLRKARSVMNLRIMSVVRRLSRGRRERGRVE